MAELYRAGSRPTSGFWRRHGSSARYFPPDTADCRMNFAPGRLIRGKLPPQVGRQFRNLGVGEAVLEGRHVAEITRRGGSDAVQDDLDQIVRYRAVQIAVQRQRGPAAEQRRAADLVANRAGALVEAGARGRGGGGAGGGRGVGVGGGGGPRGLFRGGVGVGGAEDAHLP